MLNLSLGIIVFYILERLIELGVNARNKKLLKEIDPELKVLNPSESLQMKLFHIIWFVMLVVESQLFGKMLEGNDFYFVVILLIFAQALRWYSIFTLGKYWSVDVYEMKNHAVIKKGPYSFIRHPNYSAVVMEFICLPLLLGCPVTLFVGGLVNYFIMKRRIRMEEKALP